MQIQTSQQDCQVLPNEEIQGDGELSGPPSHEKGDQYKGHEGDENVKDGSMKLVAQAIKDQLMSRTFLPL